MMYLLLLWTTAWVALTYWIGVTVGRKLQKEEQQEEQNKELALIDEFWEGKEKGKIS